MAINLQPQRIPFGNVQFPNGTAVAINGQPLQVIISWEWYKVLEVLATQAGQAGGSTDADDDEGIGPVAGGGALAALLSAVAGGSVGAGAEGPAGLFLGGAVLSDVVGRLQALETDSRVSQLQAQVAALSKRLDDIERA